jgi:membrane protease YdiL (CAAX protease family)
VSSVVIAVLAVAVYLLVVALIWRRNGVRYDALSESRESVIRGIVVPMGVGSVFLAVVTSVLGWWGPALTQSPRSGPTWALVVPVVLTVAAALGLTTIDWRSPKARTVLPVLAVGCLLVGFAEELGTRGLVLVGARDSGFSELAAALLTMVVFSLVHAMNGLFGQSWGQTLTQLGLTFVAGAAFYVTRMTTGSLVIAMLLHALWDFGLLGTAATGRTVRPPQAVAVVAVYLTGIVSLWFVATS